MMSKTSAIRSRLVNLFGKKGLPSSAISFQEIVRWKTNRLLPRLGWPGIVSIALLVMCIPFYFSTLRPMQTSLAVLQQSVKALSDPTSSLNKVDHSADTPAEQLAEFYRFFPSEKDSPRWLGMMVEIATKNGLTLNHGEYAVVKDTAGQLRRFKITLPVQGTYPQIRKYLAALIAEIPSMSLENVQFERKDIEDTSLQAKIKLVLYLEQGV